MAERDLTPAMAAAVAAGTVRPAILYEGEFVDSGTGAQSFLRLWTGVGTLSWDGKSWLGGGSMIGITPLEETREVRAVGFTATFSGLPVADVERALAGIRQGRPGRLWLALLDASGAVIEDPYMLQKGRLDTNLLEDNGETATIGVQYESRLVDLERPRERFYTPEDLRLDYPADDGDNQVAALQDLELLWGS